MNTINEQIMDEVYNDKRPTVPLRLRIRLCDKISLYQESELLKRDDLSRLDWLVKIEDQILDTINYLEKGVIASDTFNREGQYLQNLQRVLIDALVPITSFIEDAEWFATTGSQLKGE